MRRQLGYAFRAFYSQSKSRSDRGAWPRVALIGSAPRLRWDLMIFTPSELELLRSQRIARLATVGPSGWPHVVPVMHSVNDDGALEFDVDGVKLRNLKADPRAALVVDAMGPKRGVSMQGRVKLIGPERARLLPDRKFSWGL